MKKCPYCQADVADDASSCPACGRGRASTRIAAAAQASPSPNTTPCPHCGAPTAATDRTCPACGKGVAGRHLLARDENASVQRVAVVDLDMPLGSMVTLMVKWAIAAIPALLILGAIGAIVVILLAALG